MRKVLVVLTHVVAALTLLLFVPVGALGTLILWEGPLFDPLAYGLAVITTTGLVAGIALIAGGLGLSSGGERLARARVAAIVSGAHHAVVAAVLFVQAVRSDADDALPWILIGSLALLLGGGHAFALARTATADEATSSA